MEKFSLNDVCCFDCETTGVPEKGMKWDVDFLQFPRPVTMAWAFGDTERHEIIRPQGWDIPTETVAIHGITTEQADKEGKPFVEVVTQFLNDAEKCPLICAHNIYFDTSIIKAAIMALCPELSERAESALFKGKRIDTMYKTIKFVGAKYPNGRPGKYPKLEELFAKLFDGVAAIEKEHEDRYRKLLANVKGDLVFSKDGDAVWQCSNCGHIVVGKKAPDVCPICAHPQAYFQVRAENY